MKYDDNEYVAVLRYNKSNWSRVLNKSQQVRDQLRADAVELLSGTTTAKQLARMGHPYGRDPLLGKRLGPQRQIRVFSRGRKQPHYRGFMPRLPINRQGGSLLRALRVDILRGSSWYAVRLYFKPTKSLWVISPGGTRRMVARGFWREINRRMLVRKSSIIKVASLELHRR